MLDCKTITNPSHCVLTLLQDDFTSSLLVNPLTLYLAMRLALAKEILASVAQTEALLHKISPPERPEKEAGNSIITLRVY